MSIITALLPILADTVGKVFTNKGEKEKFEQELNLQLLLQQEKLNTAASDVILAEAESEHWITASWRPILMLTITAIVATNFLLLPVLNWFIDAPVPLLELPEQFWNLLIVGVGGYTVGRSAEKVADKWKS